METLVKALVDRVGRNTGVPVVKMDMKWSHAPIILRIDRDSVVYELLNKHVVHLTTFIDLCSHM
jgi:hypothetical protein